MSGSTALTSFQIEVAELFFSLPAGRGFLLAGGAALVAHMLTHRPTDDLDFFTAPGVGDVGQARDEFIAAAHQRGWKVDRLRDVKGFCRVLVHGDEELLVDIALESEPRRPSTASLVGPTFAPQELAGRKLTALWDRAAARDFVDVYSLAHRFGREAVLAEARNIDRGIDSRLLADRFDELVKYQDADLRLDPLVTDIDALRDFFKAWAQALRR